jgi:hypothetical protein
MLVEMNECDDRRRLISQSKVENYARTIMTGFGATFPKSQTSLKSDAVRWVSFDVIHTTKTITTVCTILYIKSHLTTFRVSGEI